MNADKPTPAARSIRVLLVDDQRMIGEVVRRVLLDQSDIIFQYCAEATEAVPCANEFRPDVILQDLVMPNISGLELVALYRANPATANTPVVVLSGSDDAPTRAKAEAAGANGFLVKIPPKSELVAHVRQYAARTA